jgi:hypothetical protein
MMTNSSWSNWPGNQTCTPHAVRRPASVDELSDAVASAAKQGRRAD